MYFIWIDDLADRNADAINLETALQIKVDFIDIKTGDSEVLLSEMLLKTRPDLILIDHNLIESTSGIFKKGSSVAASIRESWPECPIVCVTANDINRIDSQQKALYEEIFSIEEISKYYEEILTIAVSYQDILNNVPKSINDILELIDAPEIDKIKISSVFPKQNYHETSLAVGISKWVRKVLIKRAGFLYDRLWLCTFIGIRIESLDKVEHLFETAKYKGIFSNPLEPRWWKSEILLILYENSEIVGLPWEKGRGLENISEEDYSLSYATGKPFPEIVAFEDSGIQANQIPICIRESEIHPEYPSLLYFEDIRLMKPAE